MDRIDILHEVLEKNGYGIFYTREGKIRKALDGTALTSQNIDSIVEICTADKKLVKAILDEQDIARTRDEQKALVNKVGGKSISPLKDIHTAMYNYRKNTVSEEEGELDDGRFVYTVVPARKQCLRLEHASTSAGYDVSIPDTVVLGKKEYKIVALAERCFEGNTAITSVKLPASLETVGKNAFCNCSNLAKLDIPRHVKTIGDNAFAYTSVETLVFQDYLEEIGPMAFYKCRKLKTVEISKRTGQIGVGAFSGCSSLETITVSDKNGRFMFEDGVLYSRKQDRILAVAGTFEGKLSPPRSVLTIEQYAAEDCTGITEIELPASVTSIGAYAFENCTSVSKVKFPNTLERIGERSFENCSSLTSATVPASTSSIGKMAFAGCTRMEVASVDGTVKFRDLRIFDGCSGLNRVTVRKGSDFTDKDFPKGTRVKFAHE